jgi:5-methylcytosine-specific restriction endonuclease McrA
MWYVAQYVPTGYLPKICLRCGKEFSPNVSNQEYCSDCRPAMRKVWHKKASATYVAGHAEEIKADAVIYNQKPETKERQRGWHVAWNKKYPEKMQAKHERRRALKYGNTPIAELLTEAQWRDILDQYHHRCAYCGRKFDKLTMDHVVPLSSGGRHSKENVVPACLSCNCSKGTKATERRFGLRYETSGNVWGE